MPKIKLNLTAESFDDHPISVCVDVLEDQLWLLLTGQGKLKGIKIVTAKMDYDHGIMTVVFRKLDDELDKPLNQIEVARELLYA